MKTVKFNRYSYEDLLKAATAPDAKQIAINTLGAWFDAYGSDYWNGECYDADGMSLYPVIIWDDETDQGEVAGYEFR